MCVSWVSLKFAVIQDVGAGQAEHRGTRRHVTAVIDGTVGDPAAERCPDRGVREIHVGLIERRFGRLYRDLALGNLRFRLADPLDDVVCRGDRGLRFGESGTGNVRCRGRIIPCLLADDDACRQVWRHVVGRHCLKKIRRQPQRATPALC